MSNPPLSEHLGSCLNNTMQQYNAAMKAAAESHPQAEFLDFYAACSQHLQCQQSSREQNDPQMYRWRLKRTFLGSMFLMVLSAILHYGFHLSWDAVGRLHALKLHTDGIHMNDRAGQILTELLQPFLVQASSTTTADKLYDKPEHSTSVEDTHKQVDGVSYDTGASEPSYTGLADPGPRSRGQRGCRTGQCQPARAEG
eukprot:jgi/Chrzof1/8967/Cz03g31090.t1